jgi:hypothetical protein
MEEVLGTKDDERGCLVQRTTNSTEQVRFGLLKIGIRASTT